MKRLPFLGKENIMKSKEQIITEMCYASRHDYGFVKDDKDTSLYSALSSGMTQRERDSLRKEMERLFNIVVSNFETSELESTSFETMANKHFEEIEKKLSAFEKTFYMYKKEIQEKLDKKADRIAFVSGTSIAGSPIPTTTTQSIGYTYKRQPKQDELKLIEMAKDALDYADINSITYIISKAYLDQFM